VSLGLPGEPLGVNYLDNVPGIDVLYTFFYYSILSLVLGFFGSEVIVGMIQSFRGAKASDVPIYGHAIIAVAITTGFLALNF